MPKKQFSSKKIYSNLVLGGVLACLLTGCACSDSRKPEANKRNNEIAQATIPSKKSHQKIQKAVAHLNPIEDNQVQGTVVFIQEVSGIKVIADVEGLEPGKHGFHIHEHGDCGGKEASEAGSHFNPAHHPHGGPESPIRHVGDLGNLIADDNGHAHYERVDSVISFEGENSIIGRSIIVHADPDDYVTQPAGASGEKISCGLIEAVQP
jgi:Cu-Zn family superoxide dismutase